MVCTDATVVTDCTPGAPIGPDTSCDGVDDDCDGQVDEDYAPQATACGVGVCASSGTTSCVNATVVDSCSAGTPADLDTSCDGLDDDCDGQVDEDYAPQVTACGVGVCASTGATSCVNATVIDSCTAGTPAGPDTSCDGLDDDCDGQVDEDYAPQATECGIGVCAAAGSLSCVVGTTVDSCIAGTPAGNDASCDGLDDDCDGQVDEDCCIPTTCFDAGAGCGTIDDGCGGTMDCGGCAAGEVCTLAASAERICAPAQPIADPSTVLPDPEAVSDGVFGAMRFLFDTVQRGVDLSRFLPVRAALVRGRVLDLEGRPLEAVRVSVRGVPSNGYTYTRADGHYDLLVEGGGSVVLDFERTQRLPAQRRVQLAWGGAHELEDVVLVRESSIANEVTFGTAPQWATGEAIEDEDGRRTITVYVPSSTHAFVEFQGSSVPLPAGTLRLTEYTRGERGPQAMPADLGEAVEYTFAFEASFDGVPKDAQVRFDRPVPVYVDDFLGFPVGAIIPVASYDRALARWVPEQDGVVLELVGVDAQGRALIRADDTDSAPEEDAFLLAIGMDDAERVALAQRFPVGHRFWRVPRSHFSTEDYNASRGLRREPPDAPAPPPVATTC